jgi:hypothetical protein
VTSSLDAVRLVRSYGVTTIKQPSLLLGRMQYILLLSHPRSYTSLLSHILGSHPDITGASETFSSYVKSWDLMRLRYKTYWFNDRKTARKYVFDKVLFNFPVSTKILNRRDVHIVFTLRKPARTIKSMIKTHRDLISLGGFWEKYGDAAKCCELYVERLKALEQHSLALKRNAIYFDAEDLFERTHAIFQALRAEWDLSQDLSEEYQTFRHTAVSGGDYSDRITLGKISRTDNDNSDIVIPENILEHVQQAYDHCRSLLRQRCLCP